MRQYRDTPFFVTEEGHVFASDRRSTNATPRRIRTRLNTSGYLRVTDYVIGKDYLVHHMVMECYGPDCPGIQGRTTGTYNIHHKDDDKLNNHINNLSWLLHESHSAHSQQHRDLANDQQFIEACRQAAIKRHRG